MVKPDYECTKCKKVFSAKDYKASAYCPECGLHLWQRSFSPTPFKVNDVFKEFMTLNSFEVEKGIIYNNVSVWMTARKKAYDKYRKKLSATAITEGSKWLNDFKNYLDYKYNQSWPKLSRAGREAVSNPDRLKRLLLHLQDSKVPVEVRFQDCLHGDFSCPGMNRHIVTVLLHTFWPTKCGVWSKQTDIALKKIKRTPITSSNEGKTYLTLNAVLSKLASELHTSLTSVDGFMWYISKV